jgi:hypothetical protein
LRRAALKDKKEGRKAPSDLELWLQYQDAPWKVYPHYLENLTIGTNIPMFSIIEQSLSHCKFKKKEIHKIAEKAEEEFRKFAHHYNLIDHKRAIKHLVRASALWTHAAWKEFLEEQLVKVPPPKMYRPIEE